MGIRCQKFKCKDVIGRGGIMIKEWNVGVRQWGRKCEGMHRRRNDVGDLF